MLKTDAVSNSFRIIIPATHLSPTSGVHLRQAVAVD